MSNHISATVFPEGMWESLKPAEALKPFHGLMWLTWLSAHDFHATWLSFNNF